MVTAPRQRHTSVLRTAPEVIDAKSMSTISRVTPNSGDQVQHVDIEADHVTGAVLELERFVGQVRADHELAR
jgi:hypothetical protein